MDVATSDMPIFDALHVVSDIHMGGEPGFQIFQEGQRLADFIRLLSKAGNGQTALVLNGDIVDFLAEEPFEYMDPEGAITKLKRIIKYPSFAMVWEALANFVHVKGQHLVVVVGNHDVELALPHVRHWLTEKLSGGDDAARGRITMAMDGAGWSCMVGGKRVLCLHGNEDMWNPVDFKALLNVARAVNRGRRPPKWDANAGTRLVIDVMNEIKRKHPFVDLLKPEMEAAVPILVALDPRQRWKLHNIMSVMGVGVRGAFDWVRQRFGLLGAREELLKEGRLDEDALPRLLRECRGEGAQTSKDRQVDMLLNTAYQRIKEGKGPEPYQPETSIGTLGSDGMWDEPMDEDEKETLRQGLRRRLSGDQSFELDYEDKTFKIIDGFVGTDVDYVIAGHTHLARAIKRRDSGPYYYNSGTWISLIQLTDQQLKPQVFERDVYGKLTAGSFEALKGLIQPKPHVVSITKESGAVHGRLNLVKSDGSLEFVENTQLP
jgi:UDP-2,3-diacylglucosamine pyrophosphatase LpxH